MSNSDIEEIQAGLKELGLKGENSEECCQVIMQLREELALSIADLKKKNLPLSLAIANHASAVQFIDMITDNIVEDEGLLLKAMQGEDIYDALAVIKAKLESLIVGEASVARTLSHITQKMKQVQRPPQK